MGGLNGPPPARGPAAEPGQPDRFRAPEPILAQHGTGRWPAGTPRWPGPGRDPLPAGRPATRRPRVQVHRLRRPRTGRSARLDWGYRQRCGVGTRARRRQGAGRWRPGVRAPTPGTRSSPDGAPERTPGLAIRHDSLGERETDPGEPGQLGRRGPVGVDPLIGAEGAGQGEDAVAVGGWRARRQRGQQLDLAGRLVRSREPPADALADEPEREQQDQRTALGGGHAGMVGERELRRGGKPRTARGLKRRSGVHRREATAFRAPASPPARPTPPPSAPAPPPRRPRSAGSPALTLSIVSSFVCHEG